jgi:hypothetical protein
MVVTRRCRIAVEGWLGNSINLQFLSGRQAGRLSLGNLASIGIHLTLQQAKVQTTVEQNPQK